MKHTETHTHTHKMKKANTNQTKKIPNQKQEDQLKS